MAVNFTDLTKEDQQKLLEQARQMITEENLQRDATTVYKMMKRDLIEDSLKDIYTAFHIRGGTMSDENAKALIKKHYTSIVNYLFKLITVGKQHTNSTVSISTAIEWDKYVSVSKEIKESFIRCYNLKNGNKNN